MDAKNILLALQHTFNPQEAQRKEAEDHLKQVKLTLYFLLFSSHSPFSTL
jgi:hypothetical protein